MPSLVAAERPGLILTKSGTEEIRSELGSLPLFDATLGFVKTEIDQEIASGIHTPVPRDYSGGYTHERHKKNFFAAQKAGILYQILQDEKYAIYVRDMLFQYEAMYQDLPLHPKTRSYARGKIFWQCLNDSNWLVYMSQAYDTIYDFLSVEERRRLEDNLFRPFADHISIDSPQFFNRVHNHSTWGAAAVGMIGLVMDDEELIYRALHGLSDAGIDTRAKDDDGGFIAVEGQKAGYFANLDEPFSPDGYYTEGPYYQRYAMYPFLIFAQALENIRPEYEVFKYRDGVLLKGVDALLNLSDAKGDFFPLNDAQKGMSVFAREVVTAVNIAYLMGGSDPGLLGIAQGQGQVLLDDAGLAVAKGIRDGKAQSRHKGSINLSDGPEGGEGGIAVLRHGDEDLTLVFKYSAQGLSHGHYDKLSFSLFESGDEVLQDYGLVRYVNIEQKGGGNYLPENKTWAKQTIAHNTLTINETSHFEGRYELGSQHHSELAFFDATDDGVKIVSAVERNAYPGSVMRRTMLLLANDDSRKPMALDILKVTSDKLSKYDLPFHYHGQILETGFEYERPEQLAPLGESHGYQHLYLEGAGKAQGSLSGITWLNKRKFYTLTSATMPGDELLFGRLGANDPDFNLRPDPAFLIRRHSQDTAFVSLIEPHGSYDPVAERAVDSRSSVTDLKILLDDDKYTVVAVEELSGRERWIVIANSNERDALHVLTVQGQRLEWSGSYLMVDRSDR